MAEVALETARSGLKRENANEMVVKLASLYKDRQAKPDIGKPFPELYDMARVVPKPEWNATYLKMKREIAEMTGLDL
jgi:hypothetical protein